MDSPIEGVNRDESAPFLVKLFHRTGAFHRSGHPYKLLPCFCMCVFACDTDSVFPIAHWHRPDEFTSSHNLPPYATIYTWPTATLTELTHLLAAASPSALPTPAIGTRVAYRLLYHDTRGNPSAPRLATQDLGSVVIGDGGPGILGDDDVDVVAAPADVDYAVVPVSDDGRWKEGAASTASRSAMVGSEVEADKTLAAARFVVGDFLSVAVLPPSTLDGSVQPVPAARTGRAYGAGQVRGGGSGDFGGFGDAGMGLGRDGRYGRAVGGLVGGEQRRFRGDHAVPPVGEWRRGERLPDVPPSRGRGRRRW